MSAPTTKVDALFAVLKPELERLCQNAPQYGEISLNAAIHDGAVGRVSLGIEVSKRILPHSERRPL